jgi:hypothetical protein
MTPRHYGILLWTACFVSWLATSIPVLVHLSMTWYRGRNRVFKQLCPREIKLYYSFFAPTEHPKQNIEAEFETQFSRLYGRRRYIIPLVLLIVISGAGFCALARTVQVWQGVRVWLPWGTSAGEDPRAVLPAVAAAAFLGAFSWVVTDQMQRLRTGDLTQHDVAICVLRFLIAIPFGYALSAFLMPALAVPVAFLVGTFPTGTLMKAGQRLAVQRLGLGEDSGSPQQNELESLQCVSRSNAERFMSEGINTIAQLANADPVDLALRTNQSFDYILDCSAQALVWVHFTDRTKLLAKYALRSANEVWWLVQVLDGPDVDARSHAQTVVDEVAAALEMRPDSLQHTLRVIALAPFTRFVSQLASNRFPSYPDRKSQSDAAAPLRARSSFELPAPCDEVTPSDSPPSAPAPTPAEVRTTARGYEEVSETR